MYCWGIGDLGVEWMDKMKRYCISRSSPTKY